MLMPTRRWHHHSHSGRMCDIAWLIAAVLAHLHSLDVRWWCFIVTRGSASSRGMITSTHILLLLPGSESSDYRFPVGKVLTTLRATDPEGDRITFSINIDDFFEIQRKNENEVEVKFKSNIDYEKDNNIRFRVTARDDVSSSNVRWPYLPLHDWVEIARCWACFPSDADGQGDCGDCQRRQRQRACVCWHHVVCAIWGPYPYIYFNFIIYFCNFTEDLYACEVQHSNCLYFQMIYVFMDERMLPYGLCVLCLSVGFYTGHHSCTHTHAIISTIMY